MPHFQPLLPGVRIERALERVIFNCRHCLSSRLSPKNDITFSMDHHFFPFRPRRVFSCRWPNKLEDCRTGSESTVAVEWTPQESVDFVRAHGHSTEAIGLSLKPMIRHWDGHDVGKFMTGLYKGSSTGEVKDWRGKFAEDGAEELAILLHCSLPEKAVQGVGIAADIFLNTEYGGGYVKGVPNVRYSQWSFGDEHSTVIPSVLGGVRKKRFGEWTAQAVVDLICKVPTDEDSTSSGSYYGSYYSKSYHYRITNIAKTMGIRLSVLECAYVVEALARKDFKPKWIAKFVTEAIEPTEKSADPVEVPLTSAPSGATRYMLCQKTAEDYL